MTTDEIFSMLDARGIGGMMFHQQMADYYDFLNMCEYKDLHCERFIEESKSLRKLHCYYINHYGRLINQKKVDDPEAIPQSWQRYSRDDVGASDRHKFIIAGFEKWITWEKDTKDILSKSLKDLFDNGDYLAAEMLMDRLDDVEEEILMAKRMYIQLKDSV